MGDIEFKGHHGSKSGICKVIRKEGFKISHKGWLGKGVYFFEDDSKLARMWANIRYKDINGKVEVLECTICVDDKKVLDISNPKSETCIKVNEFSENFLKSSSNNDFLIDVNDEYLDGKILDLICNKDGYEIVRNFTRTNTNVDRKCRRGSSNISNGVELCVKKLENITKIK